jgi:hypothetical protein
MTLTYALLAVSIILFFAFEYSQYAKSKNQYDYPFISFLTEIMLDTVYACILAFLIFNIIAISSNQTFIDLYNSIFH